MRGSAALLLGCAVALGGCTAVRGPLEAPEPAPWVQAGAPQPASDAESLLQYYQYLRKLAAPDLAREHDGARQAYAKARTDFNRVRLAMVLGLPGSAVSDEARALELLESVARSPAGRLQPLAQLLSANLQEQRKLNEEQKRLNTSVQGLQQKLDALKSLERNMIERNR